MTDAVMSDLKKDFKADTNGLFESIIILLDGYIQDIVQVSQGEFPTLSTISSFSPTEKEHL